MGIERQVGIEGKVPSGEGNQPSQNDSVSFVRKEFLMEGDSQRPDHSTLR